MAASPSMVRSDFSYALPTLPPDILSLITWRLSGEDVGRLWHAGDECLRLQISRGGVYELLLSLTQTQPLGPPLALTTGLRALKRLSLWSPTSCTPHRAQRTLCLDALPPSLVDLEVSGSFSIQQPARLVHHLPRLQRLCLHQPLIFPPKWGHTLPPTLRELAVAVKTPDLDAFLLALPSGSLTTLHLVVWLSAGDSGALPPSFAAFPHHLTDLQVAYRNGEVLAKVEIVQAGGAFGVGAAAGVGALVGHEIGLGVGPCFHQNASFSGLAPSRSPPRFSASSDRRFTRRLALRGSDTSMEGHKQGAIGEARPCPLHLPPRLTRLHLPFERSQIARALYSEWLPSGLTALCLASSTLWLETAEVASLPRALTSLSGILTFIHPTAYAALPPSLLELLVSSTRRPEACELLQLPLGLKALKLGSLFASHLCLLPPTLTLLDAPVDFDSPEPREDDTFVQQVRAARALEALPLVSTPIHDFSSTTTNLNAPSENSISTNADAANAMQMSEPWHTHNTIFPPNLIEWKNGTYPSSWTMLAPSLRKIDHGDSENSDTEDTDDMHGFGDHEMELSRRTSDASFMQYDSVFPASIRNMSITAFTTESLTTFPPQLERLEIQFTPTKSQMTHSPTSLTQNYSWITSLPSSLISLTFICPGLSLDPHQLQIIEDLLSPSVSLCIPSFLDSTLVPMLRNDLNQHINANRTTNAFRRDIAMETT